MSRVRLSSFRSPSFRPPSFRTALLALISALTLALPFSARTDDPPSASSREPRFWVTQTASGEQRVETMGPGTVRLQLTTASGATQAFTIDPNDEGNVLVQLSEAPLAAAAGALRSRAGTAEARDAKSRGRLSERILTLRKGLEDQHQRVRATLSALRGRASARRGAAPPPVVIKREYHHAFNGFALRATPEVVEELRRHPDVVGVYPDVKRKADLAETVPLVGAPDAWALGLTGAGAVVAIVDTGVDYSHPDLGGCLGPGCRVLGGYDFVNQDADPKDDHGHGTHVAGIVAANGALKGVAPDARLMAFKVLDDRGEGVDSDIIAAVERACDPTATP
jgi:subtilisin family serine protease